MRNKSERLTLLGIIALLISSMITVLPVFSALPPRHFPAVGGVGAATFYTTPRDNNFTSPPTTVGTWFTVDVRIANATHVASWQVELSYNKNYLFTAAANVSYASDMIFPPGSYSPIAPAFGVENATHDYVLMTATTNGAVEYNTTAWPASKGLMRMSFKIIASPGPGQTLWTSLRFEKPGIFGCWTSDTDLNDNELYLYDGYFQIKVAPLPPSYLALSPTAVVKPTIPGDRIIGTPDALFDVNMLINNVNPTDFLILAQFNVTYDRTLVRVDSVLEGTFMNNSIWAPYGTMLGWNEDPGMVSGFIIILPNGTSGQWDMAQFPGGSGLLLTIRFRAIYQPENATNSRTTGLLLNGIFDSFFVSANETDIPYDPPVSGSYTIFGFNWAPPTPQFTWTPSLPLFNAPITFNANASRGYRNVDGVLVPDLTYIQEYSWSWGDGSSDNVTATPIITHTYDATGDYNVTLTITDNDDKTNSLTKTVTVYEMFNLEITTTTGGTANPAPGGHLYFPGTNATVTAIPNAGYYFNGWELDSVDAGSTNPITVTMDSSHTLHAVFSSVPPSPPILEVTADVGNLHFPGETAEFYVFVTFQGKPANATVKSFKLYFSGALLADLTGDLVSTGLYRVRYNIPTTATPGTYVLVVQVEYYSALANTLKSFMISQMLDARLTAIENGVATISSDIGIVKANLTDIKATITKIDGEVVFINSTLGEMETTLTAINARVVSIDGNVVTLQTDLGTVKTSLDDVEKAIGDVNATAQTILYVTSALSAIAAIAAILVLVLFLRKRK